MNENTNPAKRREWVKNAAIIFLVIMLVLTFFSNTFMNYSLPEVATEYVQSGTITEKVRGTGNLEASDPYNVVVKESRKIESVNVKNGDVVEKDAVLFYLEDVESEELKTAQKELDDLRLAYLTGLFTGDISSEVISKVESGKTSSLSVFQTQLADVDNRITAAKNSLMAATANQQNTQNNVNNLTGQQNIKEAEVVDTIEEQKAANAALTAFDNANARVKSLTVEKEAADNAVTAAAGLLGSSVTDEAGNITVQGGLEEYQKKKADAESVLAQKTGELPAAEAKLAEAQKKLEEATAGGDPDAIRTAQEEYNQIKLFIYDKAVSDVKIAEDALIVASGELETAAQTLASYNDNKKRAAELQGELDSANNDLKNAEATKTAAEEALSNKKISAESAKNNSDLAVQIAQANISKTDADAKVTNLTAEITKLEAEKSELIKSMTAQLNLGAQNDQISKKEEEIEKLKEKSTGANVTAPVAGTVTSINLVAGESTKPEEVLAVIQPTGKGFTLSFSATTQQAKKLSVGDIAEIQNAWYYEDVKATLTSIKPDTEDPAQKKKLTFKVEGNVQPGQSLSLSVGQKSANYELVVPNSALREDKNGKFILTVESRSTPLGNRYIATRADVEVLASDDTHTAVSAGLYGYEYVITTATKPVEAGKQVRLAD